MEMTDVNMTAPSSLALASDASVGPMTTQRTSLDAPKKAASGEAETIAVCIRVRPLNEREVRNKDVGVLRTIPAMSLISLTDTDGQPLPGKHNVFQYDHIFDEHASTRAMYERVAQRIVKSSLDGINGTIFAYGQTSSGKTYTMTGTGGLPFQSDENDDPLKTESMGILQLAVEDIFGYIEHSTDRDFLLRVSFVEIYNEVVKDLLNPSEKGNNLKLREDPRKGVYVESKEEIITNYEDILRLLHVGNQRRTVGMTAMNDKSSRSHSIFRIVIESKQKSTSRRQSEDDVNGAVLVASLSLVDLAGSESMRHTAAEGVRQREAGNINKSLLTLSRVINTLASGPGMQNAPFRDSKLTRLLQNSLDGNTRTLIICCVTPSDRYLEETKSTLQFAARAKTIQTSASVNEVLDDQAQLKRLKREVYELKKLVNSDEAYNALKAENEALQNEQNKNKAEIARLLGLMLSSSSAGVRELSVRKQKPRNKRMRETWHPGDFSANMVHKQLRTEFGGFPSPNPQPRKRQLPDNAMEQNLLSALDDAADDNDDSNSVSSRRTSDGDGSSSRRRESEGRASAETQMLQLVEALENAIASDKRARFDDDEELPAAGDLDARITRLVNDCKTLASTARQHEQLEGDHEVLKMAAQELQMRLQLSKDQEAEELENTKQLLEHVKNELAEAHESDQLKDEEWQKEKESWLVDRQQMESTIAELRSQLEAMSGLGGSEEMEQSLRELTHQNKVLNDNLSTLKLTVDDMQHSHDEKIAELEASSKREVDELSSQLQDAFVELEELKLEKDDEIAKLEEDLLSKSDELEQKIAEFTEREVNLLHEIEGLKHSQNSTDAEHALVKRCEELAMENERLTSERSNLMDALVELEEQLQQTSKVQSDVAAQVTDFEDEKAELNGKLASLELKVKESQHERDTALAQLQDTRSSVDEQYKKRIEELEQELAQTQDELREANNDQEAEANRADEVSQELQRTKQEMEKLVQEHAQKLQELRSEASQHISGSQQHLESEVQRLTVLLSEKELQIKQAEAVAVEARSYRDFLQAEMDDLSQKVSNLENAKTHFANENAHLRQQLTELNTEMLQVPETLAGELEELTERIESLRTELETKDAHEKILTTEIKKLMLTTADQDSQLAEKENEVARLQEQIKVLDEEKAVWFQKSASSDELQAELVRMREERWGLATKWEESEAALTKERREAQRLATELKDLEDTHNNLEDEKIALEKTLAEQENKVRQLSSELDATQTEKSALEELVSELEGKFEVLEIAKKSLDDSLAVRVAELTTKGAENSDLRTKLDQAELELRKLRENANTSQDHRANSTANDHLHARIQQLESQCQELEASKLSLAQEADDAKRAKSNLVEELSALEAQLMALCEEKIDLQSKLDSVASSMEENVSNTDEAREKFASLTQELEATREVLVQVRSSKMEMMETQNKLDELVQSLKASLLEKDEQLQVHSANASISSSGDLTELTLRLENEVQRREKAELDAKSYEEALELMREDFKNKLNALKSSQLAVKESNATKQNLVDELAKLRLDLARAKEEQAELRFQNQQRLLSTQGAESVLKETVEMLEQELATTKETLSKCETDWKARAHQAEQQFRRLEAELQATNVKELAAREKLGRVEEQLATTKDTLVETETEWKARANQAEQHFRRLAEELRSVNEERMKLKELVDQSFASQSELERLRDVNQSLQVEMKRLEGEVESRERHWADRVEEITRKSEFENSNLRVQCQEAQDEVSAFKQYAEGQIAELRASIEQNDIEMLEKSRLAKQREESLSMKVEKLEAKLEEMHGHAQSLQAKLHEKDESNGELVAELSRKVEQLTEQLSEVDLERNNLMEQFANLKATMEKLEGEDYQHRNELEELAESLKSAQMEAVHYHSQLVEVQLAKEKLDTVVETQKKRIDKLEQVKMTKETLAVFQKIKNERQSLQVQVQKLEQQLKDANAAKALTKEAAEQQQHRLVRLKEEEVGMLKTHIEELKAHTEELQRAVQNEKDRNSHMRKEFEAVVEDIRGKAKHELDDVCAVLKEKSGQVDALEAEVSTLKKDKDAMIDHKSSTESYLEKENLDLLVENRQLKKLLEGRGTTSNTSSHRSTMLDDDVAAFEASAKAANALLAEPSAASAYSSFSAKTPDVAVAKQEQKTPSSTKKSRGGLSGFLMSSSTTDTEEEEARPACSQQ